MNVNGDPRANERKRGDHDLPVEHARSASRVVKANQVMCKAAAAKLRADSTLKSCFIGKVLVWKEDWPAKDPGGGVTVSHGAPPAIGQPLSGRLDRRGA